MIPSRAVHAEPAGELDPTFSGDGWAVVSFDFGIWSGGDAKRILAALDGKILIAGRALGPPGIRADFAFARLTASGDLDPTFGTDGRFTTGFNLGGDGEDVPLRFALGPGGSIVAVGYAELGDQDRQPVAVRIRESLGVGWGLDPTFAGDGKLIWDLRGGNNYNSPALGVDVLAGGEVIAGGMRIADADYFGVPWVSKLHATSGSDASALDPAFGDQGLFFFGDTWSWHDIADTAVTRDGKILAVGVASGEWSDMLAFRLQPDGQLDPSFAGVGWVSVDLPGTSREEGTAIASADDGSVFLVGQAQVGTSGHLGVLVAKLDDSGAPDSEYGTAGLAYVGPAELGGGVQAKAAVLQGDGRLVVAGALILPAEQPQFVAFRLTPTGSLDASFGNGGVAHLAAGPDGTPPEWGAWDVGMQPDGRLLLLGTCYLPSPQGTLATFCAARLTNDYIFADGFEAGSAAAWSQGTPTAGP
jgi:uncharacterized delta-60 repeat protein